jgi:hypothetical protein
MLMSSGLAGAASPSGPLTVHPTNGRYFADGTGKAVCLTGSHFWANMQDEIAEAPTVYSEHLDFLAGYGHNFTRAWHWEDAYFAPLPYARPGPGTANDGGLKFDLTQYNQAYFDRIRARAVETGNRGMYISIMLFEGWSLDEAQSPGNPGGARNPSPWPYHPYNSDNNINGIDGDSNNDNRGDETHTPAIPAVTALQEDYVEKTIDELNDLDNIIWEVSNESRASSVAWQYHIVNHIKAYEATKPKQHLVAINARGDWNNADLFNSPADIISPNNASSVDYLVNPPATTGNKIILLDTDHLAGVGADRVWVWKSCVRGYQPIYMDPLYPLVWYPQSWNPNNPQYVGARWAMGDALNYVERMDLAGVSPQASSTASPSSTRYCLYETGETYLVYQPASGAFTLELPAGTYEYQWFDPTTRVVAGNGSVTATGGAKVFTPPFGGNAVLFIGDLPPTLIEDTFSIAGPDRDPDDVLNDTDTEVGAVTWNATLDAVFAGGGSITNTDNTQPRGSVPFDPSVYSGENVSVSADLNVVDGLGESWLSVGFMSGTGSAFTDGQVWVLVRRDGRYSVWADRTVHEIATGDLPVIGGSLKNAYLAYDPTANRVSVWVNGVSVLANFDLDALPFTPAITRAGFTSHRAGNFPAGAVTVDNFTVRVGVPEPPLLPGDFNHDGDVDLADYGFFQACYAGPSVPHGPGCEPADFNSDGLVDANDLTNFQGCMGGANAPPGC